MHPICHPKFCITFVFYFSWVLQPSQEKLRTIVMPIFFFFFWRGRGGGGCILGNVEVAYTHLLDATHRRLLSRLTRDERCCYLDIWLQTWLTPFLFCVGRVRDHSGFDEHLLYCPWLVTRHISRLWRPRCGPLYQVRLERHFQTIPFSISIYYCVVACEYSRVRN